MKWRELIDEVADRTGYARNDVLLTLRAMCKISQEAMSDGEEVVLRGVGTLFGTWRGPRTMRSVSTGDQVYLDGRYIAQFKPARPLKAMLIERSPQTWQDPDHQAAWQQAETLIDDMVDSNGKGALKLECGPTETDTILAACRDTFGDRWSKIEATYSATVPDEIRQERNYLAVAAHRRWAATR